VEDKNSRILHYCCCCCGGGGGFGFSVFTTVRGFFFPPPTFPLVFRFQGVVGLRGFFFWVLVNACCIQSPPRAFCVVVVWVSVFAEQHSLHLLSTFVSHSFIHSLKGEFLSS